MDWNNPRKELDGKTAGQWLEDSMQIIGDKPGLIRLLSTSLTGLLDEDVSYDAVQKKIRVLKVDDDIEEQGAFNEHWELYCKLIGRSPSRPNPKRKLSPLTHRRVGVLCDTHGSPDPAIIAALCSELPDIVVYNGDVLDALPFSKFPKEKARPISDEIAAVRASIEKIIEVTGAKIYLLRGNHDDRVKKYFEARIDSQFMPLVRYDLMELIALGLEPSVEIVKTTLDFGSDEDAFEATFLLPLGDALIGHAEASRKGELRTVDIFAEWIDRWRKPLGWTEPRLIVQAHVHRAGISYPHGGHQVRVEGGYSGDVRLLQYAMDYGNISYTPPVKGYTIFEQDKSPDEDWKTNLSSVRFVLC